MSRDPIPSNRPEFDAPVEPGGYRWWYLDGISEDGERAITIIVFIGSVFSPYYRWARARGNAIAQDYCAFNIALYGHPGKRWAMTERGAAALRGDRDRIEIGPSSMCWSGDEIRLDLDEISVPWPARIRGHIRLIPASANHQTFSLDSAGRHRWQPLFPQAAIEVDLQKPALKWRGTAYFDTNYGSVPLERDFTDWDWSRSHRDNGSSCILYDRRLINGDRHCLALRFERDGALSVTSPEAETVLPKTGIWRIPRSTRGQLDPNSARPLVTLEDTPFYARSLVTMQREGQTVTEVHESLSMTRFTQSWVHLLLPFRMPRIAGSNRYAASA